MSILVGKVALVTGGGRGIGRAVAQVLAEAGAAVAVLGRDKERLDSVRAEIAEQGATALALNCDVTDSNAVNQAFAATHAELGPIDILVNNAGITASVKFAETDDATWDRIMRVNATGAFYCCRAAVPDMLARNWGRIINIASYAALRGIPYSAAYSASKHALLGLTRSLALELARRSITVNAICPGWVETEMVHEALATIIAKTGRSEQAARASLLEMAGQPRMIMPKEVAAVVLRLAGPEGANTNGQAITVE
jgi:NAD(P)-dependent dehydrogenase (short-subunit alcohol dehydrogenase family)